MKMRVFVSISAIGGLCLLPVASSQAQTFPPMSCGGGLAFPGGASACRDYLGSSWNPGSASADCAAIPGASGGVFAVGSSCNTADIVGVCRVAEGGPTEATLYFYGGDTTALANACEGFLNGTWASALPAGRCDHFAATAPGAPGIPACKQYSGSNWSATGAEADCAPLAQSNFTVDATCGTSTLGYCTLRGGTADEYEVHYYAGDPARLAAGCEGFGGGVWTDASAPVDTLLPEAYAALQSDAQVTVSPNGCDGACLNALIASKGAITFSPTGQAPTEGFLYIPGGTVDPRAYAVAARQIAAAGYFVAIIPFAGGIAIADPFRPTGIIASHPEIEHWAIGGHSLGGVTAALYADVDPLGKIDALAIFAGYPPANNDLSDDPDLRVYSLLGTEDDNMDMVEWTAAKARLPANTYYGIINGGNHEQFGYYTGQLDDGAPLISRKQQHDIYVGATIHMLRHLDTPASETYQLPIYSHLADNHAQICRQAQLLVGGFKPAALRERDVQVSEYDTMVEFRAGRAGFVPNVARGVSVVSYSAQTSNPDDVTAPPIFEGEIWCKLKSQEAIATQYNLTPKRAQGTCAAVNAAVFDGALKQLDKRTREAFKRSHSVIDYAADKPTMSGPEFIDSPISLSPTTAQHYSLVSPSLVTPMVVPAPFGGVFYCKLWSPEAAIKFIENVTHCGY